MKTLSDADAGRVDLTPVAGEVTALRALPTAPNLPQNSRIAPVELTTFTVTVRLVEFKQEEDRDIHLVVADPSDPQLTMIVEFPNTEACSGADVSAERLLMAQARAALIAAEGTPPASNFKELSGLATITGVGFFDFKHGQRGVAPNAIELHPVLAFETTSAPPDATSSPTATPEGP